MTVLLVTVVLLAIQTILNITGTKVMAQVARIGVYVELVGTFGIAIVLGINGFHHGLGYLFSSQGAAHVHTNALGYNFHGNWWTGAALIAVLAPVYIFYGFESAGDIAEETKDASRLIPRAMRLALIWGGIASLVLTGGLLLAIPHGGIAATVSGGVPVHPRATSPVAAGRCAAADHLCLLQLRHIDPGRGLPACVLLRARRRAAGLALDLKGQRPAPGPGQRAARRCLRDGAVHPARVRLAEQPRQHPVVQVPGQHQRPVCPCLLRRQWHLPVVLHDGDRVDRSRGHEAGFRRAPFRLGRWGWPVCIIAAAYLGLMFLNVVLPTGLTSPREAFNYDWITLMVMVVIAIIGGSTS